MNVISIIKKFTSKKDLTYIVLIGIFGILFFKPDINSSKKIQANVGNHQVVNQIDKMKNSSVNGNVNITNNVSQSGVDYERYTDTSDLKNITAADIATKQHELDAEFYYTLYKKYRFYMEGAHCAPDRLGHFADRYYKYCKLIAADKENNQKILYKCKKEIMLDLKIECIN